LVIKIQNIKYFFQAYFEAKGGFLVMQKDKMWRRVVFNWIAHRDKKLVSGADVEPHLFMATECIDFQDEIKLVRRINKENKQRQRVIARSTSNIVGVREEFLAEDRVFLSLLTENRIKHNNSLEIKKMPVFFFELRLEGAEWKIVSFASGEKLIPADSRIHTRSAGGTRKARVSKPGSYNRNEAVSYAAKWWDGFNPAYKKFLDCDCTNFVSQVLRAGGFPTQPSWNPETDSWRSANAFYNFLKTSNKVQQVTSPDQLELGDIIMYSWGGNKWDHSAVVVGFEEDSPLVAAHSIASYDREWPYTDSPSWTEKTAYAFFHIRD
jgi:hypothetical protein